MRGTAVPFLVKVKSGKSKPVTLSLNVMGIEATEVLRGLGVIAGIVTAGGRASIVSEFPAVGVPVFGRGVLLPINAKVMLGRVGAAKLMVRPSVAAVVISAEKNKWPVVPLLML